MTSERIQRRIDSLLDEAEAAIKQLDWSVVRDRAEAVLAIDPGNPDGRTYLATAERATGGAVPLPASLPGITTPAASAAASPAQPTAPSDEIRDRPVADGTSFANGRYQVKRFLGEGGKKKVYLAHDGILDRDVALAVIKAEGLDNVSRARVTREAQAMGRL